MTAIKQLTLFSIIKLTFLMLIVAYGMIGLAPDEAQYWTWSQALDFGYYSKPPGISWQIFATTKLLGNHELGVRLGAMIWGIGIGYIIFFLSKALQFSSKISLYAALAFICSPLGFYLSFAATTDGGAIFWMMVALLPIASALSSEHAPRYEWVGLFIALAALFKWTAFILWPLLAIGFFFVPKLRHRSIYLGIIISLLGLLPSLYWNMTHSWATYRHVFSSIAPTSSSTGGNFLEYLVSQVALFSPLFFLALIKGIRKKRETLLLLFVGAALLLLLLSLFKKMQPNWALYLYPPLMLFIGLEFAEKKRAFLIALASSLFMVLSSVMIPYVQEKGLISLPYAWNPYRQSMGVRELTDLLVKEGYDSSKDLLFSDKYQNSSLLSFYGPEHKRAYFMNLGGARKNQFTFWPQMEPFEDKRAYFVVMENKTKEFLTWYENHYQERLMPYFSKVAYLGAYELFHAKGAGVKHALVFCCEGYKGALPEESTTY